MIKRILIVISAFVFLFAAQRLVTPKNMAATRDGALAAEYYNAPKNNEVLFVGDCEVYENFSPVTLYEEYGITSYVRGGPQQLMWHSYYTLEDALRYETPKIVVFNALAMQYPKPQREEYNRLNLEGLRWSKTKIDAINASKMEGEDFWSYVFPLLRYHERWKSLSAEDFQYFFDVDSIGYNGFLMNLNIKPLETLPDPKPLADYDFGSVCWEYLNKMNKLCSDRGIKFVLIKAPTLWPHWYSQWDAQIAEWAESAEVPYFNLIDDIDAIGIDWRGDTYDAGQHLNVWGAEKLSRYFGKTLKTLADLTDFRENPEAKAYWQPLTEKYNKQKGEKIL